MKIIVVSTRNESFDGSEGRVLAAALRFNAGDGQGEKELTGYGLAMAEVLKWQSGEEHEIEPYTTRKGKPSFRLPNSGGARGGGGGRGFEAAFRNTRDGQLMEQAGLDKRTAVMQSIAAKPGSFDEAMADRILAWLRKQNGAGVTQ
jgi:hypothetical protein